MKNNLQIPDNKDSYNFFDIEKEYFIIDSDYLDYVQSKFYGYSIQSSGIYEKGNLTEDALEGLDGNGAYLWINVKKMGDRAIEIHIQQDFNGCYGIYLYQSESRFVLSNSFFRLLDYIKFFAPLTLDREYANHFLLNNLCSHAYSETPVKEVKLLDRNLELTIDVDTRQLTTQMVDYAENTIAPDSEEGLAVLDDWYYKWTSVFQGIFQSTNQIIIDLSGGIDSRITFMLMLKSGIDLDKICVNSNTDKLHTHKEDYAIASQIAEHFGFPLNKEQTPKVPQSINYSLRDILNISYYTNMAFHKEVYFMYSRFAEKHYRIRGSGGGILRPFWDISPQKFLEKYCKFSKGYSASVAKDMHDSSAEILNTACRAVKEKFPTVDFDSEECVDMTYRETRCRSHFGKVAVLDIFENLCALNPLMDPTIRKIQRKSLTCKDNSFLVALLFMRYDAELLEFPFEGGRAFNQDTIQYAKSVCDTTPFVETAPSNQGNNFSVISVDKSVVDALKQGINNTPVPQGIPEQYLRQLFNSRDCKETFEKYFNKEIYTFADIWERSHDFYPMRYCNGILGLIPVLEDINSSQKYKNQSITKETDQPTVRQGETIKSLNTLISFVYSRFYRLALRFIGLVRKLRGKK